MAGPSAGLERAILASLALHAVFLFGVAVPRFAEDFHEASPPLEARIVEQAPPGPAAEKPAEAKPVEKKARRRAVVSLPAAGLPPPAPEARDIAIEKPVFTATPGPAVEAPRSRAADPATVGTYRAQLLAAAGRFKRYPEAARENSWTGNVVVGVAVAAGGAPEIGLRRSSGHAVLDEQALDMFRQAARAVPLPETLRGREFRFDVRAVYGLED